MMENVHNRYSIIRQSLLTGLSKEKMRECALNKLKERWQKPGLFDFMDIGV
jgi:hypothetical protein